MVTEWADFVIALCAFGPGGVLNFHFGVSLWPEGWKIGA